MFPTVTIAAPVRDRAWILSEYLKYIYNLNYPKDKISLLWVINDSKDISESILKDFKRQHDNEYQNITIMRCKLKAPQDKRITQVRDKIYYTLSQIRNMILDMVDTDYLFSVDTDILLTNPDSLKILVESNKDIVAGVINNDAILNPNATYPNIRCNILNLVDGKYKHYKDFPLNSLFEVDATGALILISKEVCKKVKYGYHPQGEDIKWSMEAQKAGYKLWCNSNVWGEHVMWIMQDICKDCIRKCKAPKVEDNIVYPDLVICTKKH